MVPHWVRAWGNNGGYSLSQILRPDREAQGSYTQVKTYSWSQVFPHPRKGGGDIGRR